MKPKPDPHRFDDLFSAFGPVTLKRLFSGEGIYADGKIMGLVVRDVIYFKTDEDSRAAYKAETRKPFYFTGGGKRIASSYYAIPERLYDDAEELAEWARDALKVSSVKPQKKKKRKATKA
jgi:DNA transformation protein and related proteins